MNRVKQLQSIIFERQPLKIRDSRRLQYLNHYPPDINDKKLANLDPFYRTLHLREEWVDIKRNKELSMEARRKTTRCSVVFGWMKAPEKTDKKKKRRR